VPCVPWFTYALHDISACTNAEIKGAVLTRLVQLAMRWIFSKEPLARLGDLLTLIEQVEDRTTALEILESLLRYYVQVGTGQCFPPTLRTTEPLAADGRPEADGRNNAKLELVAAMLGVVFDDEI